MNTNITCDNMIKQQLRTGNVLNESILDLYKNILREDFVPDQFKNFAYSDLQIPLANQQVMMTPLEEALLLQELKLTGNETVLEIGTGSGFLTALLSKLSKNVISIDYFPEFINNAKLILEKYNINNVELICADANQGYIDKAPYDIIIFSGGIKNVTDIEKLEVLPGGKLFAIIGEHPVMQARLLQIDKNKVWTNKLVYETYLPPLINKLNQEHFVF
jgi:protein-L-isoaspartate(D-aspartate) O-methyltransferase